MKFNFSNHLNMTHALCGNQSSLDGRLESREKISAPGRQRYRRVQEVLVGVGMRQVGELGTKGSHFKIDVVISIE
jgi:hypothetical protein